ncbi:hypothetical protein RCO27_11845 [Sphingosinicella sp. LHD-64]|uniref:hypothetical protein n=1 Tax=Sphingosinicella sp. LHD-64 TaxID=3072139 RepID=UPI00280D3A82|nr:hypothetical protein [Sphingosinicella sp. LHD-64]MDQ8756919.1 hypothetical protein [Sphingosinicella sp. LHD-64]
MTKSIISEYHARRGISERTHNSRLTQSNSLASRRELLGALTIAPLALSAPPSAWASVPSQSVPAADEPVVLWRTREGRSLSRFRYHNAESFFLGVEKGVVRQPTDKLYQIGIVLQLGLSSHLLDVGFADAWCARHVGLQVARSLAHANATGLGFESADMELLAAILSPYSKWRHADVRDIAPDFPFTAQEVRTLTRALLDRVHEVTGHPRPRGWRQRFL